LLDICDLLASWKQLDDFAATGTRFAAASAFGAEIEWSAVPDPWRSPPRRLPPNMILGEVAMTSICRRSSGFLLLAVTAAVLAPAERPVLAAELAPEAKQAYQQAVQKGIDYLAGTGQAADGSFSSTVGPGVTAIIATAVMRNGRTPDDPLVAKSLKYLEKYVQPDGGIYDPKSRIRNYETCLAIVCLKQAGADGRYDKAIAGAEKFLKGLQWSEGDKRQPDDLSYGGVGYGGADRPDLSNTAFLLDALEAAGAGPDDEAVKRALVFVSRCQNLETEYNTTPFAAKVNDGGFYYTPLGSGGSPAGTTPDGGLRSYGSMTYAGLKSMIFAGVTKDDPRVKAALAWISKFYSLTENPGLGEAGLYYYYQLFGKALDASGLDTITDAAGVKHDWRSELVTELAKRQQPNGSWINSNSRWMEGDPNLATGFALLTLSYCRPSQP
jgi:squalene-hopene/tetraprenyl-beta-curcumene cyclase